MKPEKASLSGTTKAWLQAYVHMPVDAWPAAAIVSELLAAAPFAGGPIYRGMNFRTEGAWNTFAEQTHNFTVFETQAITSWSHLETAAAQYCLTRPTYELNGDLMTDESARSRNRDFMIGHAGVVLQIEMPGGCAVDLDRTAHGMGGEAEVLLPPGRYQMTLLRTEIPFVRSIDKNNVGEYLDRLDPGALTRRDAVKFTHIINRFTQFTAPQRHKLFELAAASAGSIGGGVGRQECPDYIGRGRTPIPVLNGWCDIPDEFVAHYDKFLPEDQVLIDRRLDDATDRIDAEFDQAVADLDWDNTLFTLLLSPTLAEAVETSRVTPRFPLTVAQGIARYYRKRTSLEATKLINDLPPSEKGAAVALHAKQIAHALSQRVKTPKLSRLIRHGIS